jgi:hypothetical protein
MLRALLYRLYERRLLADVLRHSLPKVVGLIQHGHRQYALDVGLSNSTGYAQGAAKAEEILAWYAELKIARVTSWWLPDEVGTILDVIESKMGEWVSTRWMEQLSIRIRRFASLNCSRLLHSKPCRGPRRRRDTTPRCCSTLAGGTAAGKKSLMPSKVTCKSTLSGGSHQRRSLVGCQPIPLRNIYTRTTVPIPISLSVRAVRSACPGSCCGKARTVSIISATSIAQRSGG